MRRMQPLRIATGLLAMQLAWCAGLSACAAPATGTAAGVAPVDGARLLVRSVAEWPTPQAFAERVAEAAGVPARDTRRVAPGLYALTLSCTAPADCEAAVRRLADARQLVIDVQPDRPRQLPALPNPAAAQ